MTDIIKNKCDFDFYFNKTDVTPTVLDGGDKIALANWPNDKHIICNVNNDIPIKIPSHPYVLVNKSVLCNCRIEADNHHLLESIATCDHKITKLIMYFTINLAFTNYLDMLPNLTDSLPIIKDRTRYEQPLPFNLSIPNFDSSSRHALTKLKKLNRNYLWDTLEIDWNNVTITFNDSKIDLPKIVVIKIRDKIKVRILMNREPLNFHVMIRQGITWFNLETETEIV